MAALWMAAFAIYSLHNSLRRNWMLRQSLLFAYWLPKHPVFLIHPLHSQLGRLWLPTPHCAAPVWLTGRHAIPLVTRCFPPYPPREAEDFPRGGNHSRHMSLLIYLAWLQPICYKPKFVFNHVETEKVLLVVKSLIKKHRATATLISSHKWEN